jgi:hypothetical protein
MRPTGRPRDEREPVVPTDAGFGLASRRLNRRTMTSRERVIVTALVAYSASEGRRAGLGKPERAIIRELREEIQKPQPSITDSIAGRVSGWRTRLDRWKATSSGPCEHQRLREHPDGCRRCRDCGVLL